MIRQVLLSLAIGCAIGFASVFTGICLAEHSAAHNCDVSGVTVLDRTAYQCSRIGEGQ